jgi:hypothetical protein
MAATAMTESRFAGVLDSTLAEEFPAAASEIAPRRRAYSKASLTSWEATMLPHELERTSAPASTA